MRRPRPLISRLFRICWNSPFHRQSHLVRGDATTWCDFRYYISPVFVWTENYLLAAAFTALTFLVRLLVLVMTLPLNLTAAFVGLIEGLVRPDLRRFGAGRESGFVYHRAKARLMPPAVLP